MTKYSELNIPELVELVKAGEKRAFGELYDRYIKTVYNKCLSFTRDRADAEDIAQDIFVKVYEKLAGFDNKNFGAWLMRITYNQCVDFSRRASKHYKSHDAVDELEIQDSEQDVEAEVMAIKLDALEEILKKLDPIDRTLLVMKYQEEKKIYELAELFDLGESAVKMRLSRAKLYVVELYRTEYGVK